MACILNTGYSIGCRDNIGGIQEVYIGDYNGDTLTFILGVDDIIGTFSAGTSSFYSFEQEIETGSFNQTGQFSTENGTSFYEQTLELTVHKMDAALRNQIKILGQGKWRVLIKDQRGKYWLMGAQNPVRLSAATPGLGKAYGDLNGAILTFMGKEPVPAYEVDATAALQLIV
jgi:hypothetical protein